MGSGSLVAKAEPELELILGHRADIDADVLVLLRARPEITESTFDRVRYGFTTCLGYHML